MVTDTLRSKDAPLIDMLAMACSGCVTVDCPEDLLLSHNSKCTAEAVFNLPDNAVKYTPVGGAIRISVEQWEITWQTDIPSCPA